MAKFRVNYQCIVGFIRKKQAYKNLRTVYVC